MYGEGRKKRGGVVFVKETRHSAFCGDQRGEKVVMYLKEPKETKLGVARTHLKQSALHSQKLTPDSQRRSIL